MIGRVLLILSALFFISGCSSSPRFTKGNAEITAKDGRVRRFSSENEDEKILKTQTGIVSFYAEKFNGKPTYSGEIYDMNGISAAHPFYPMGTIVRVTNLKNGKSVTLTINDRMPYRSDRIMDLSLGAAKKLGFVKDGITKAKVEVLKWGKGGK